MTTDRQTAKRRLTNNWNEQVDKFPSMREKIPLELYIRRNLAYVMKYDLLVDYSVRS